MSAAEIHKEFLIMQRRMRRLRLDNPGKVSARASLALTMLAKQPEMSLNELASFLRMDQGNLSRFLTGMQKEGYLKLARAASDGRSKRINFTDKGLLAIQEASKLNHYLARRGMQPLNDFERERIGRHFAKVSAGFGAHAVTQLEGEELFVSEQMRLLRTLGMIGSSYLGTQWDMATYQILFSLYDSGEFSFSELKKILPIEPSQVSRELTRLVELKLVRKSPDATNRKAVLLSLTAQGKKQFQKVHEQATAKIAVSVSSMTADEIKDLLQLLRTAGSAETPQYTYRQCVSSGDYFLARAILVERLVQKQQHMKLPSSLLTEKASCFLIERSGVAVGVAAIDEKKTKWMELPEFGTESEKSLFVKKIQPLLGQKA